jgi:hypothetical protein
MLAACDPDGIRVEFYYGGAGAGSDLGGFLIRYYGGDDECLLAPDIRVSALRDDFSAIDAAVTPLASGKALPLGVVGSPAAQLGIAGAYKADTATGRCPRARVINPAYWRLAIGARVIVVRNQDPFAANGGDAAHDRGPGVFSCAPNGFRIEYFDAP